MRASDPDSSVRSGSGAVMAGSPSRIRLPQPATVAATDADSTSVHATRDHDRRRGVSERPMWCVSLQT